MNVSRSPATTSTGTSICGSRSPAVCSPGRAQHPQEHREVDVRHVREVRQHVLGVHPLRVDLARLERELQRELRRAGGSRSRAPASGDFCARSRSCGKTRSSSGHAVERARDVAEAAAHEHQAAHRSRAAGGTPRARPGSPSSARRARTADPRRAAAPPRDRRRGPRCRRDRGRPGARCARGPGSASARAGRAARAPSHRYFQMKPSQRMPSLRMACTASDAACPAVRVRT